MKKLRLDDYLLEKGYFDTRSQAQGAIISGKVKVNGEVIIKSGTQVKPDIQLDIKHMPYVSRGGFKLEKAVREFNIDLKDRICLDIGASTGGFTDFMLQNGAKKVYAIDVGYGQLAWKLRNDQRVVVMEKTNIRNLESLEDLATFTAVDASFISINKILEKIKSLMEPQNPDIVLLIKPQFEAGREQVPKSGVIKDKNVHIEVIKNIAEFANTLQLYAQGLTYSPIKGPAGNIEYLIYLSTNSDCSKINIEEIVDQAHENL